jgi:anti-sigma factor RsiW
MIDQWTDRLSEYLDDELAPGERGALESHLLACAACRGTLSELRSVVERARSVAPAEPARDLWPAIAARVRTTPQDRIWWAGLTDRIWREGRVSLSVPQFAGAAGVLVVLTAVLVLSRGVSSPPPPSPGAGATAAPTVTLANFADVQYEAAVSDLKRALEEGRGRLDPQTVAVLERNLAVIDAAILQAREALAADPANAYLNSYLAEARRRKLELLRQVTGLADMAG